MYGFGRKCAPSTNNAFVLSLMGIAGRVEHTQIQPELDGLVGKFIPAKDRPLEVDIGKKCINLLRGT